MTRQLTLDIRVVGSVTAAEAAEVLSIDEAATTADGVAPLDDQVRLDLEPADHDGSGAAADPAVLHLLARRDSALVGYAHARSSEDGSLNAHLVVEPQARRAGVGTALVHSLLERSGPAGLRVWAHGDEAAAGLLSERLGFARVRDLWQMRRRLDLPVAPPAYPPDVHVRTFEPGQDDAAWVQVNAAAFAGHPEQGAMTVDDLRQRIAQPWFDPLGFFLAVRDGELLGFHWTKVHPAEPDHAAVGEVYAVGVSPQAQGLGLGKALTATGLLHLRSRGLSEGLLYVDGDNAAAIAVYEKLGFTRAALDVMYATTPVAGSDTSRH